MSILHDEPYRLRHYQQGEKPQRLCDYLIVEARPISDVISKVVLVMEIISHQGENKWVDDEYWQVLLPDWLLNTFRTYSDEESEHIRKNRLWDEVQWTFDSWLDRMRERDWEWWSVSKKDNTATICFTISGHPYSVKPLEHLIESAGGTIHDERV